MSLVQLMALYGKLLDFLFQSMEHSIHLRWGDCDLPS